MPSPLSRQVRWSLFARLSPSSAAFPVKKSGRLLQLLFRDLLGVHSTLWPARSRSRLATLSIESSDSFVASAAVSIATGWNEPVPGRELHPLKSSAFHGALFREGIVEACVDKEVSETGMVYPMNQNGEISRHMIALCLFGACWIQVQTSVHVDNASLKRN